MSTSIDTTSSLGTAYAREAAERAAVAADEQADA
jgi:hypothetical protein